MVRLLLPLGRLVAVEAGGPLPRMLAEFVLVDNGVLPLCMALSALARSPDERRPGLVCFRLGSLPVHQKGADDEPKPDNQCDEDGSERQVASSSSTRDLLRPVTLASSWGERPSVASPGAKNPENALGDSAKISTKIKV
jgi:hypothetical protein